MVTGTAGRKRPPRRRDPSSPGSCRFPSCSAPSGSCIVETSRYLVVRWSCAAVTSPRSRWSTPGRSSGQGERQTVGLSSRFAGVDGISGAADGVEPRSSRRRPPGRGVTANPAQMSPGGHGQGSAAESLHGRSEFTSGCALGDQEAENLARGWELSAFEHREPGGGRRRLLGRPPSRSRLRPRPRPPAGKPDHVEIMRRATGVGAWGSRWSRSRSSPELTTRRCQTCGR